MALVLIAALVLCSSPLGYTQDDGDLKTSGSNTDSEMFRELLRSLPGGSTSPLAPNSTEIVEEIIRLLELGEREIELSEQTDIILVVGQTGSGKSTTTQFIAGENNTLVAVQNELTGDFYIVDRDGTISNQTIISKTLLPDLTVERETNTAFYDCPGFSDTRNESVEIANSFFIKKVADHGQRIKILVVAHDSILQMQDRTSLPDLLKQLVMFIKDVDKMKESISLVGTNCKDHHKSDAQIVNTYAEKLKTVIRDLPDVWQDDELLTPALQLLNVLLTRTEDNSSYAKIGFFRTPAVEGPLDDNPIFEGLKLYLKNLIWNNTIYVAKTKEDFGYSLSSKSYLLLGELVASLDKAIVETTTELSAEYEKKFSNRFDDVITGSERDLQKFKQTLERIFGLTYDECLGSSDKNPLVYMHEIIPSIYQFTEGAALPTQARLQNYSNYLEFIQVASVGNVINIHPNMWVQPFVQLNSSVHEYMDNTFAPIVYKNAYNSLEKLVLEMQAELIKMINSFNDVYAKSTSLETSYEKMKLIQAELEAILSGGDYAVGIKGFIEKLLFHLHSLDVPVNENTKWEVEAHYPILDLLAALHDDKWTMREDWNKIFNTLCSLVETERTWTKFLTTLMTDLSKVDVQSSKANGYQLWWNAFGENLDLQDFDKFWTKFSSHLRGFDQEVISDLIHSDLTEKRLASLNLLLSTTMSNLNFECQSPNSNGIVFYDGLYVSLKDVFNCLKQTPAKSVILLSYHSVFVDTTLKGADINLVDNLNLFVMSPNWWVNDGRYFDLGGSSGPSPPSKPRGTGVTPGIPGEPGRNAGNMLAIGQNFGGGNVDVVLTGGSGGGGQDGQDGEHGIGGYPKSFNAENKVDCKLRSYDMTWELKVYIEPNFCKVYEKWNDWCWNGGMNGGTWLINGTNGTPGWAGNAGGKGGVSGNPGMALLYHVNTGNNQTVNGAQGQDGSPGQGGFGGKGGIQGALGVYGLDDDILGGKCKLLSSSFEPASTQSPSGANGDIGGNGVGLKHPIPNPYPTNFFSYIENYRNMYGAAFKDNEFLRAPLREFILKTDEHLQIPA
jgi:hypothetical protein